MCSKRRRNVRMALVGRWGSPWDSARAKLSGSAGSTSISTRWRFASGGRYSGRHGAMAATTRTSAGSGCTRLRARRAVSVISTGRSARRAARSRVILAVRRRVRPTAQNTRGSVRSVSVAVSSSANRKARASGPCRSRRNSSPCSKPTGKRNFGSASPLAKSGKTGISCSAGQTGALSIRETTGKSGRTFSAWQMCEMFESTTAVTRRDAARRVRRRRPSRHGRPRSL